MSKMSHLLGRNDPDTHNVVGVTGEQSGAIGAPGKRDALDGDGFLTSFGPLGLELIHASLGLEVPNLNGGGGSSAEPVANGRKDKGVNDVTSFQTAEVATLV